MAGRRGLSGLPKIPKRWNPQRALRGTEDAMETRAGALQQDAHRLKAARRDLKRAPKGLLPNREVRRLIKSLKRSPKKRRQKPSLASAVSMLAHRIQIVGWVWDLFCTPRWAKTATAVDITPNGWEVSPEELLGVDPRRLLKELRAALYRDGAAEADGYLVLFLEAEFGPPDGPFRLHCHGVAAGGMLAVLHRMRKRKKFRKLKGQRSPIVIKKQALRSVARLAYILKSDWFAVWRGIKKDGTKGKSGKRRIRSPYSTLFRVWLNRWTIDDVCLRIHLTVGADGFIVSDKNPYKKGGGS